MKAPAVSQHNRRFKHKIIKDQNLRLVLEAVTKELKGSNIDGR